MKKNNQYFGLYTKKISTLPNRIIFWGKKMILNLWRYMNIYKGNRHLDAKYAILKKPPFFKYKIYLRPTYSDMARVREFYDDIYFNDLNYLNNKIKKIKPSVLIDLGANIGTASLNLKNHFNSIKLIIAIEADKQNFSVLKKNFDFWKKLFKDTKFNAMNFVASCSANNMHRLRKINFSTDKILSSSGSISFMPVKSGGIQSISVNEIVNSIGKNNIIICKIDIEGGEQFLFENNLNWMKKVAFINIEIHDKYHIDYLNSSTNFLKALVKYDFAIIPNNDILYCYNRNIISN